MFNEILIAVTNSVLMVTAFGIFMFFCMISNTILGSVLASKTNTFKFEKLLYGLLRNIGILLGIDILAAGFSGLTKLIEIYGIAVDYADEIKSLSDIAIISVIIGLAYKVYGKQAFDKIKQLGGINQTK